MPFYGVIDMTLLIGIYSIREWLVNWLITDYFTSGSKETD